MKSLAIFIGLASIAVAVNAGEILSAEGRKMLVVKCSTPSMNTIQVAKGWPVLELLATGYTTYFCNKNVLDHDGEAFADVRSPDGVWVGKHLYPTSGPSLGQPTWFLTNTITGENRTIYGENKPQVRQPADDGNDIDYSRREVYSDTTNGKPSYPRAWWILRTNTSSTPKPKGDTCSGDQDVQTNFTAVYTFISCDYHKTPLLPAAAPQQLPVVLPPAQAPVPAVSQPIIAPIVVPVVAPLPVAVPTVAPVPAPAPIASPPVQPVIPTVAFNMPPPAPKSSAVSLSTAVVAISTVAAVAMVL